MELLRLECSQAQGFDLSNFSRFDRVRSEEWNPFFTIVICFAHAKTVFVSQKSLEISQYLC